MRLKLKVDEVYWSSSISSVRNYEGTRRNILAVLMIPRTCMWTHYTSRSNCIYDVLNRQRPLKNLILSLRAYYWREGKSGEQSNNNFRKVTEGSTYEAVPPEKQQSSVTSYQPFHAELLVPPLPFFFSQRTLCSSSDVQTISYPSHPFHFSLLTCSLFSVFKRTICSQQLI